MMIFAVSLYFPEKGVELSNGVLLRFPSPSILFKKNVHYADINKILKGENTVSDSSELSLYPPGVDTNLSAEMRAKLHRLQFPDNDRSTIYNFLESLFQISQDKNQALRIMHFGDSQIEGDRMSSTIRYNLQSRFGGGGPGLVTIADVVPAQSINRSVSPNWKRYTAFGGNSIKSPGKAYGPMLSFSRFTSFLPDSLISDSIRYQAWVKFSPSKSAYSKTSNFNRIVMFMGYNKSNTIVELLKNENEEVTLDTILKNQYFRQISWHLSETPEKINFKISGNDSPNLYGISFDNGEGINVDNIPMRGSSGVDFVKTDLKMLEEYIRLMNVKLLILQFGVNVAPNVVENYKFYEDWLYNNLMALKNHSPELNIIVIGISDMARKNEATGAYESLPNIKKIRDAQKNAAFRAKCAFWDIYEAMGGENSMPSWVYANPPLAVTDFTHFNAEGARYISQMFVNALIAEYTDYEQGRKKTIKTDSNNIKNGKNQ